MASVIGGASRGQLKALQSTYHRASIFARNSQKITQNILKNIFTMPCRWTRLESILWLLMNRCQKIGEWLVT
jgi:hypothetical protein